MVTQRIVSISALLMFYLCVVVKERAELRRQSLRPGNLLR
jgi:hypothetical protein